MNTAGQTMLLDVWEVYSEEIRRPELPNDPKCCLVSIYADICARGRDISTTFSFQVTTPQYLLGSQQTRWGKGYLITPEFEWGEVDRMVGRLVSSIQAKSWEDAISQISIYLD